MWNQDVRKKLKDFLLDNAKGCIFWAAIVLFAETKGGLGGRVGESENNDFGPFAPVVGRMDYLEC